MKATITYSVEHVCKLEDRIDELEAALRSIITAMDVPLEDPEGPTAVHDAVERAQAVLRKHIPR